MPGQTDTACIFTGRKGNNVIYLEFLVKMGCNHKEQLDKAKLKDSLIAEL